MTLSGRGSLSPLIDSFPGLLMGVSAWVVITRRRFCPREQAPGRRTSYRAASSFLPRSLVILFYVCRRPATLILHLCPRRRRPELLDQARTCACTTSGAVQPNHSHKRLSMCLIAPPLFCGPPLQRRFCPFAFFRTILPCPFFASDHASISHILLDLIYPCVTAEVCMPQAELNASPS